MKERNVEGFPTATTISSRLGSKRDRARKIIEYCRRQGGLDDIIAICEPVAAKTESTKKTTEDTTGESVEYGFVYLMKSGEFYKIGRSGSPGRRQYELASHRPEGIETVHTIKTDDPEGIEAYWHHRFRK